MAAPLSKARDVRKMYEDAGVMIDIVKYDGVPDYSNDELEYTFTLANTLGAQGDLVRVLDGRCEADRAVRRRSTGCSSAFTATRR